MFYMVIRLTKTTIIEKKRFFFMFFFYNSESDFTYYAYWSVGVAYTQPTKDFKAFGLIPASPPGFWTPAIYFMIGAKKKSAEYMAVNKCY